MILDKIFKGMGDAAQVIQKNFETIMTEFSKNTDTGWVDVSITNGADAYGKVRKINNVVYCRLNIVPKKTGSTGDDTVALIIPVGFRPLNGVTYNVSSNTTNGTGIMQIVDTTGEVRMWSAVNMGGRYYLYTSWVVD